MDISVFFQPVDLTLIQADSLGMTIHTHLTEFPELDDVQIALLGVGENRKSSRNEEGRCNIDPIRKALYNLHHFDAELHIADLGTIEPGESYEDTAFALRNTVELLVKKNIIPVIIGGTQDLTVANYLAYENLEQVVNLVTIDRQIDLGLPDEELTHQNYLKEIVLHRPNFLFNLANIASQRPYNSKEALNMISKMYFDNLRLGKLFEDITQAEPLLRNADIVSIDLSALRYSDTGSLISGPNGLYADQMCQLCKYAGMSDKLTSFGIYEYRYLDDHSFKSAQLIAEMIWYFIQGVGNRKGDFPIGSKDEYVKYTVALQSENHEIVFYKSPKSNRWWMEVPYTAGTKNKYYRNHLIPCTYKDYQIATNDEVPDRWWMTYQKLAH